MTKTSIHIRCTRAQDGGWVITDANDYTYTPLAVVARHHSVDALHIFEQLNAVINVAAKPEEPTMLNREAELQAALDQAALDEAAKKKADDLAAL